MNGVLVVDKPSGPTSHDVVAVVRRAIGIDRVGHTGTLDPLATGVLPLVIGRATRLASFISGAEKEYLAKVRFGASTATYDAEPEGERTDLPLLPRPLDGQPIAEMLVDFVGTYWQMPPPFSAKKIAGTPAYRLARRRKPVDLKPVEVTVRELELLGYTDGLAELRIVCSSGFYVRSLAHDLGERLECGAYLEGLQRTRVGDFTLGDATSLADVGALGRTAVSRLIPLDRLLTHLPSVVLSEQGVRRASHGNALSGEDLMEGAGGLLSVAAGHDARLRLFDGGGALVGIAEPVEGRGALLHPVIVLV
jgi:tRNA pseudouridine55 synthase